MMTQSYQGILWFLVFAGVLSSASDARPQAAPSKPTEGSRSVSPAPAVHTTSGHFSRVVVVRLKYDMDILEGLKTAVAREKIRNAVILSGAGSLTSYHAHVVSNTSFPPTNAYFKGSGPYDLLTTTGYVIEGRVHAHITFSDTQKALGGHLEPGTRVFTFAIITLGVLEEGTSLKRFDDYNWR